MCVWRLTCISCTFVVVFFLLLLGIDLENIVYYKDDTHYFVMTAKKQSLLEKGVILHVSAQKNSHFAVLLQINITFMHNLEKSGTFFCPFVHLCCFLFLKWPNEARIIRNRLMTQAFDDSSSFP